MAIFTGAAVVLGACTPKNQEFRYTTDQFADIKIIRYQVPGWDELTLRQKAYAYHLSEAAKYGQ